MLSKIRLKIQVHSKQRYRQASQKSRRSVLDRDDCKACIDTLTRLEIKGYTDENLRKFIKQIERDDQHFRLQAKEFHLILQELVQILKLLKQKIVEDILSSEGQYHRIEQQYLDIFNEIKLKKMEPYCQKQKLVNIDIYALFSQKNYEYENYSVGYRIHTLIPPRIISQFSDVPLSNAVYKISKAIWYQFYNFVEQAEELKLFNPFIDLLCLLYIKQKVVLSLPKSKTPPISHNKVKENGIQMQFVRPKGSQFKENHGPLLFKFCQIFLINLNFQDISCKNQIEQSIIKRNMQKALREESLHKRGKLFVKLMLEHSLSLASLIEWWNRLSEENDADQQQRELAKIMEAYKWQFLKPDNLDERLKGRIRVRAYGKQMRSHENAINLIFCRMALERMTLMGSVMTIQNHLMAEVDKVDPLYVHWFEYPYSHYCSIHQKSKKGQTLQRQSMMKSEAIMTLMLGVHRRHVLFAIHTDEILNQFHFSEIITTQISKKNLPAFTHVCISEFSFNVCGFKDTTVKRLIIFFKKKMKTFLRIDARPINFSLHFRIHTRIDTFLCENQFLSEQQFKQAAAEESIKIINTSNDTSETTHFLLDQIAKIK